MTLSTSEENMHGTSFTTSEYLLMHKRKYAVERVLRQKNLSRWARNYWRNVYNDLLKIMVERLQNETK